MCGIVGILDLDQGPVDVAELQRMNSVIRHRGPDDHGYYVGAGVGLGMSRLSIIDLASGQQPIGNEEGSVWVVFNGEIYNFERLRDELEAKGHEFRTHSDTEVLVHLYEEEGERMVERLRGMFAFALWDGRRRRLLLARDRFGIKPLYYGVIGRRLVFASELKAILQLPAVERRVDFRALEHVLSSLSTPPEASIIEGVKKLPIAHTLSITPGGQPDLRRYWQLEFRPDRTRSDAETAERLREILSECVQLHMISDVPLGAFLSGGMDSSSIVALMSELQADPVKTYSIGFPEADFDESDDARLVADAFGTDHHDLMVEPDVVSLLEDIAWHLDEPFGDSSAIPTYIVSKMASQDLKVVLTGDGGDEIFAGYDDYVWEKNERRFLRFLPGPVRQLMAGVSAAMPVGMKGRNMLRHMALPENRRHLDHGVLFRDDDRRGLLRPEIAAALGDNDPLAWQEECLASFPGHWLSGLQKFDIEGYLPLDILTKVDRMSMAHSIETRVPLLDHRLAEFAATIPPERLLRRGSQKYALREAMRGVLPDRTLDKPKRGFAVPLGKWVQGQLRGLVDELLLSDDSVSHELLRPERVRHFVKLHRAGGDLDLHIWTLMSLELWCRQFLRRDASVVRMRPRAPELQPRTVGDGTVWHTRWQIA